MRYQISINPKMFWSAFADVQVGPNRTAVSLKLNTGASANVIPTRVFTRWRI